MISIESRHPQSIRQGEVAAGRDIWHPMGIRSCGPTGGCWRIPHWSVRIDRSRRMPFWTTYVAGKKRL